MKGANGISVSWGCRAVRPDRLPGVAVGRDAKDLDPTSLALSKTERQQHHVQIVLDLGNAGFSVLSFYQMTHCLQSQNYKKGIKKSRMEGRTVKNGTRCNGIPTGTNGSFLHYIIFDD